MTGGFLPVIFGVEKTIPCDTCFSRVVVLGDGVYCLQEQRAALTEIQREMEAVNKEEEFTVSLVKELGRTFKKALREQGLDQQSQLPSHQ